MRVTSEEEYVRVGGEIVTELTPSIQGVKAKYEVPKKKAHARHKTVCSEEKQELEPLVGRKAELMTALNDFNLDQERRLREQYDSLRERFPDMDLPPFVYRRPAVQGLTIRRRWKWRAVDIDKIGGEYLTTAVDDDKVNAVVKELGEGAVSVVGEGIEVWCEV